MKCPNCGQEAAHKGQITDTRHSNHSLQVFECANCGWDNIPR